MEAGQVGRPGVEKPQRGPVQQWQLLPVRRGATQLSAVPTMPGAEAATLA